MNDNTAFKDLEKQSPMQIIFRNCLPAVITMLMTLIYNLADTFFIGQTHDAYMMAAVSLVTPIFTLFSAVGIIFGTGGGSYISRLLGAGDIKRAKETNAFSFWTALVVGMIIGGIVLSGMKPISILLGSSQDTNAYVMDYLKVIAISAPFMILSNAFSNILRAEGQIQRSMIGSVVGNLVNIVLDPVMIMGLGWGIRGAAVATLVGNTCAAIYYILFYISGKSMLTISLKHFRIKNGIAAGVLAIGIPASLNNFLMTISNIIANNLMRAYGDMAVAGFGVAMKIGMILAMILMGIGIGIQPVLGYCFGAGFHKKFKEIMKYTLIFAFTISVVLTIVVYAFSQNLVNAFVTDINAYSYGLKFVWIFTISGPILGLIFVVLNALQAIGAAYPSLIVSISRQGIIYIPLLFIFGAVFKNAAMITAAQPVADLITLIIAIILYLHTTKKEFAEEPYAEKKLVVD